MPFGIFPPKAMEIAAEIAEKERREVENAAAFEARVAELETERNRRECQARLDAYRLGYASGRTVGIRAAAFASLVGLAFAVGFSIWRLPAAPRYDAAPSTGCYTSSERGFPIYLGNDVCSTGKGPVFATCTATLEIANETSGCVFAEPMQLELEDGTKLVGRRLRHVRGGIAVERR